MRIPRHLPLLLLALSVLVHSPAAAAPDVRLSEILAGPATDWDGSARR